MGITYKMILELSLTYTPLPLVENLSTLDRLRDRTLRDYPIHKFVEPVETNPDVTSASHPAPSCMSSQNQTPSFSLTLSSLLFLSSNGCGLLLPVNAHPIGSIHARPLP